MASDNVREPINNIETGPRDHRPKSHGIGRRWPVLVACFVSQLTTGSMAYHTGVLYVGLLETFEKDVVITAWLGAFYAAAFALTGPIASLVVTISGCRTALMLAGVVGMLGMSTCFFIQDFFLFYPALLVAGIGQGLSMTGSFVALGYHFPDKASLVTGICVSGAGLGTFIHPPLLQILMDEYGLHGALLVVGAVCLHSIPCGLSVPTSPFEQSRSQQQQHLPALAKLPRTLTSVFRAHATVVTDFRFFLFMVSFLGFSLATSSVYLYLPDFLQHSGYNSLTASLVISATGFGSVVSRLLTGIATNDDNIDISTIYIGIHGIAATVTLLLPVVVASTIAQMVLAVVFGIYTGSSWALHSPMVLELLGVRLVATGMGVYFLIMGVAYMMGPPIAGQIYTAWKDFHHIFYFSASMYGLACLGGMLLVLASGSENQNRAYPVELLQDKDRLDKSCDVGLTKPEFVPELQNEGRSRAAHVDNQSDNSDETETLISKSEVTDTATSQSIVSDQSESINTSQTTMQHQSSL